MVQRINKGNIRDSGIDRSKLNLDFNDVDPNHLPIRAQDIPYNSTQSISDVINAGASEIINPFDFSQIVGSASRPVYWGQTPNLRASNGDAVVTTDHIFGQSIELTATDPVSAYAEFSTLNLYSPSPVSETLLKDFTRSLNNTHLGSGSKLVLIAKLNDNVKKDITNGINVILSSDEVDNGGYIYQFATSFSDGSWTYAVIDLDSPSSIGTYADLTNINTVTIKTKAAAGQTLIVTVGYLGILSPNALLARSVYSNGDVKILDPCNSVEYHTKDTGITADILDPVSYVYPYANGNSIALSTNTVNNWEYRKRFQTPADFSSVEEVFVYIKFPVTSNFASIDLLLSNEDTVFSSSTNKAYYTVAEVSSGASPVDTAWNLFKFPLSSAVGASGFLDLSKIKSLSIKLNQSIDTIAVFNVGLVYGTSTTLASTNNGVGINTITIPTTEELATFATNDLAGKQVKISNPVSYAAGKRSDGAVYDITANLVVGPTTVLTVNPKRVVNPNFTLSDPSRVSVTDTLPAIDSYDNTVISIFSDTDIQQSGLPRTHAVSIPYSRNDKLTFGLGLSDIRTGSTNLIQTTVNDQYYLRFNFISHDLGTSGGEILFDYQDGDNYCALKLLPLIAGSTQFIQISRVINTISYSISVLGPIETDTGYDSNNFGKIEIFNTVTGIKIYRDNEYICSMSKTWFGGQLIIKGYETSFTLQEFLLGSYVSSNEELTNTLLQGNVVIKSDQQLSPSILPATVNPEGVHIYNMDAGVQDIVATNYSGHVYGNKELTVRGAVLTLGTDVLGINKYCVFGGASYLESSDSVFNFTGNFSLGFWAYSADWSPISQQTLISRFLVNGWSVDLTTTGFIQFQTLSGGVVTSTTSVDINHLSTSAWHHFAIRRTAGGAKCIDVDSLLMTTNTDATDTITAAGSLEIGSQGGGSNRFTGRIDEVFVHSGTAWTDEEVRYIYSLSSMKFAVKDLGTNSTSIVKPDHMLLGGLLRFNSEGTSILGGSSAISSDFPYAKLISSQSDTTYTLTTYNIGFVGESTGVTGTLGGAGLLGIGRNVGNQPGTGVYGVGKVSATGDTNSSTGGNFVAIDTHAGGSNIAVYANAASGALNYSFYGLAGQAVQPDGSAALPSWSFKDDLNTGMYRIGSDSTGFSVGGNEIFRVTSTGLTVAGAGNIAMGSGTVDGVDVSAFKSSYDSHDHSVGDPAQVSYADLTSRSHALSGGDHSGDLTYSQLDSLVGTTGGGSANMISGAQHVHNGSDGSSYIWDIQGNADTVDGLHIGYTGINYILYSNAEGKILANATLNTWGDRLVNIVATGAPYVRALYAEGIGLGSIGVYGKASGGLNNYGVYGAGDYSGVYGSGGYYGVMGAGSVYGVYGYGGSATTAGVYGVGTGDVGGSQGVVGVYGNTKFDRPQNWPTGYADSSGWFAGSCFMGQERYMCYIGRGAFFPYITGEQFPGIPYTTHEGEMEWDALSSFSTLILYFPVYLTTATNVIITMRNDDLITFTWVNVNNATVRTATRSIESNWVAWSVTNGSALAAGHYIIKVVLSGEVTANYLGMRKWMRTNNLIYSPYILNRFLASTTATIMNSTFIGGGGAI